MIFSLTLGGIIIIFGVQHWYFDGEKQKGAHLAVLCLVQHTTDLFFFFLFVLLE